MSLFQEAIPPAIRALSRPEARVCAHSRAMRGRDLSRRDLGDLLHTQIFRVLATCGHGFFTMEISQAKIGNCATFPIA